MVVQPPAVRKQPGRPKKKRKKAAEETSNSNKIRKFNVVMSCNICSKTGHNKRGCPLKDTVALPIKRVRHKH